MTPLTEYTVRATPSRRFVEVYDADAYLGDDEAFATAQEGVVAGDGYHLFLHSMQQDIKVRVSIRIWEAPCTPPSTAEGTAPVTLESVTGTLVINQLARGPAGTMELPRPGVYEGHVWWNGRQATGDYYDECIERGATEEWSPERIGEAWEQTPVEEHYMLELWYVREPEPVDEDDE